MMEEYTLLVGRNIPSVKVPALSLSVQELDYDPLLSFLSLNSSRPTYWICVFDTTKNYNKIVTIHEGGIPNEDLFL